MSEEKQKKTKKADGEKKPKRPTIEKNNAVLEQLEVTYVPIDSIKPNKYNPNRQSEHDFKLLCASIAEDGFTQPVVAQRETKEIVDGEHRWRACKALGYEEIPVVFTDMTAEQMRIATLRHNRARGSEDEALAGEVFRQLASLGAIDHAKDSLQLDDVEVERMMKEMGEVEAHLVPDDAVPQEMLGPSGKGLTEEDKAKGVDTSADTFRAKQKMLEQAKAQEERKMLAEDQKVYRLMLFYTGEEAEIIKLALDHGEGQAANLLALCAAQG